ncbi:hypothetical protein [Kitasatospora sp. NPDC093806]|uniref:hypothetical protein n=1 Tax=Kitasatospora sp. NPDC093806 TaxID=3155075 RepID=UPI00341AF28C
MAAFGLVAAIAGTALAVNAGDSTPSAAAGGEAASAPTAAGNGTAAPAPAPADGGAAGGAGAAAAAGGTGAGKQNPPAANQPLNRIRLPGTFLGMPRNDNGETGRLLQQQAKAAAADDPNLHPSTAVYQSGAFGENYVSVVAFEGEAAFSQKDRAEVLAQMPTANVDQLGMRITHGEVKEMDPGPLGGVLRCAVAFMKTDPPTVTDLDVHGMTQCAWLDENTYVVLTENDGAAGYDLDKTAEHARQLRAQAETRR